MCQYQYAKLKHGVKNVSPSRISEYLNGKSEPKLKIVRLLRDELNIDADIILG